MDKIFQILVVFGLLMLAVTYSVKAREKKIREYYFSGQFTFPLSADLSRGLVTASLSENAPAFDAENQLFFRGGADKTLEITDSLTGDLVDRLGLDEMADVILFDPASRLIYGCSVDGAVIIIRQSGRDGYKVIQHLVIPQGCTSLSLDPYTGKLYIYAGVSVCVYSNEPK